MIGIVASVIQNIGNRQRYCLGGFHARVPSTTLVFIVKLIYIFFWTWILNLMCKDGHTEIAWFMVLIPFVLIFIIMAMVMGDPMMEGFSGPPLTPEESKKATDAGWTAPPAEAPTIPPVPPGSVPPMGGSPSIGIPQQIMPK